VATRIIDITETISASTTTPAVVRTDVKPATGLKWICVEVRPVLTADGIVQVKFADELYWEFTKDEVDLYRKPYVVTLDLAPPHYLTVLATNTTTTDAKQGIILVVEEEELAPAT